MTKLKILSTNILNTFKLKVDFHRTFHIKTRHIRLRDIIIQLRPADNMHAIYNKQTCAADNLSNADFPLTSLHVRENLPLLPRG